MIETITIEAVTFPWAPIIICLAGALILGAVLFIVPYTEIAAGLLIVASLVGFVITAGVADMKVPSQVRESITVELEELGYANVKVSGYNNYHFTGSFDGEYRNGVLSSTGVTDEYFVLETPVD